MTTIADDYRTFADTEARGASALWYECAHGIAGDPEMLDWIAAFPPPKRQPNLVLAAVRFVAGTPESWPDFRARWAAHRDEVAATVRQRATQTNEPARSTAFYPLLAALPQPIALLEFGASAGLNLIPDRYAYDYDGVPAGDPSSPVVLACRTSRPLAPGRVEVAWRAGVDLNPLDVRSADDMAWLETLVWPGMDARRDRLRAAVALAAADPPPIHAVDRRTGFDTVRSLAAGAPAGATLVVTHSAVLYQLAPDARREFVELVRGLPGHWVGHEGPGVLPGVSVAAPAGSAMQVLALDGRPVAFTAPHGGELRWLDGEPAWDAGPTLIHRVPGGPR